MFLSTLAEFKFNLEIIPRQREGNLASVNNSISENRQVEASSNPGDNSGFLSSLKGIANLDQGTFYIFRSGDTFSQSLKLKDEEASNIKKLIFSFLINNLFCQNMAIYNFINDDQT